MSEENADAKPPSNVIKGPWKTNKVKIPDHDMVTLQQDMAFIEELSESVMVQMIYTLGENGVDISEKDFLQDIAFVVESLKSTLFREMGLPHPMSKIIRMISEISVEEKSPEHPDGAVTTQFSIAKLQKVVEQLNIEKNDNPVA